MQKDWGRLHNFVALSTTQLATMLQPALPGQHVTSLELLTAGHCNTNYKITVSGQTETFVLRIYTRNQTACQKDVDIFGLVGKGHLIPEIIYADPHAQHHDQPYSIMRWVDGVLLSDVMATKDD